MYFKTYVACLAYFCLLQTSLNTFLPHLFGYDFKKRQKNYEERNEKNNEIFSITSR